MDAGARSPNRGLGTILPWVESPLFSTLLPEMCHTDREREQATLFHDKGFLVLEDFFPGELLDRVIEEVGPLFDPNVPDGRRSRSRVQDGWRESEAVRRVALDERLQSLLRFLYGRRPVPFQTLNFQYGTEQAGHSDSIHFHSFPPRFMCGVWVAMEDVGPDNGALFYYPGSNRLPAYTYLELGLGSRNFSLPERFDHGQAYRTYVDFLARLMEAQGLERVEFTAKKGSVLIWAANLIHGGSPVLAPGSTRWSQVTHYYFEDCFYYTPLLSNWATGDFYLRQVVDIGSGETVPHRYGCREIEGFAGPETYKLVLDAESDDEVVRAMGHHEYTHLKGARDHLMTEVENHKKLVHMIETSLSFRLGRALTAPFRLLRNLATMFHRVRTSRAGTRS